MKIYYLVILAAITLSCAEAPNQDENSSQDGSNTSEQVNTETNSGIEQRGDYSSLFNRSDCKVITAEEISTLLGMSVVDQNVNGMCSFKSDFSDGKTWYLGLKYTEISANDMQREIDNFQSDETGMLSLEMSETGDTYFCIQHSHGYLSMYNPNYNGFIGITYGSVGTSRGFSKEERLEHRAHAVKIANELLRKHTI